jgi:aspartate/methionine/tyrosine aminotransferase
MMGLPALRQAVARHDRRHYGLELDWASEVLVTSGATEALAACLFGLLDPGDEAVVFEPFYDAYVPLVRLAGAEPRLVSLSPPHWSVDEETLRAAFGERTRVVLLNTPMNPSGKVWRRAELEILASLAREHDAVVVCDEVYEHLVFDGAEHVPMITLPGMRERCVRIASAGKTFSLTGWKVGYVMAAAPVLQSITRAHQFLVFATAPNLQQAVAFGLDHEQAWYGRLAADLQRCRDLLGEGLERIGMRVLPSAGTYFLNADFRPLDSSVGDFEFCRRITTEAGVTAVPLSAFYGSGGVDHLIRFCFCKRPEVLKEAVDRLGGYFR